ncbi:BZ3500_MvSof-1268-A1-R1_Chr7-2g09530 [Microbotryum saponariae]|uniref:BZ3500_MvSof-1268-A1-R1_Chr7-2g09530 protein n=1 Tax=Microbotryum saponariae TaxID=289078 RepID=A0A2X0KZ02_9BASI|nr:BZ3501_MvSof-1269-A2-R1_Chr7-1g09230 [Microbotryum saponariae]SDA02642.1 BZ3500_MvSof-1268-A1-R1_Chr7-2g09530 [Microbotryum saponariae]
MLSFVVRTRRYVATSKCWIQSSNRGRATLACLTCRRKRIKCSVSGLKVPNGSILPSAGEQPTCGPCRSQQRTCEWSWEDKRKPYTKDVVDALKQQIANLESKLAELSTIGDASLRPRPNFNEISAAATLSSLAPGTNEGSTASHPRAAGGLARNAHGELRFFGPGSTHILMAQSAANQQSLEQSAAQILTRAPNPRIANSLAIPPRPPELDPVFRARLLRLAFDYALPLFQVVDERRFLSELNAHPDDRTDAYSPFMLNIVLGIGCRYLDPEEDIPREVCSDPNDLSTKGDVFINYARFCLDSEWNWPKISTLRGLVCLALYLTGRGMDGLAWLYTGMSSLVAENFGLHLLIAHLPNAPATVDDELVMARRDAFFAIFSNEVLLAMHIGRNSNFRPDEFDQVPGLIDPSADFDPPLYRSSVFHWSSRLATVANKILSHVYVKRGEALATRKQEVPSLHLELQTWYHALPSHIKVATSDTVKTPSPLLIACFRTEHRLLAYTAVPPSPLFLSFRWSCNRHTLFNREMFACGLPHCSTSESPAEMSRCSVCAPSVCASVVFRWDHPSTLINTARNFSNASAGQRASRALCKGS